MLPWFGAQSLQQRNTGIENSGCRAAYRGPQRALGVREQALFRDRFCGRGSGIVRAGRAPARALRRGAGMCSKKPRLSHMKFK